MDRQDKYFLVGIIVICILMIIAITVIFYGFNMSASEGFIPAAITCIVTWVVGFIWTIICARFIDEDKDANDEKTKDD